MQERELRRAEAAREGVHRLLQQPGHVAREVRSDVDRAASAEQSNLDDDNGTCQKGAELCVPNEMLQPNFKGPACTGSTFLTGDYDGVCLSDCLSFSFIQSLGISRGSCHEGLQVRAVHEPAHRARRRALRAVSGT